MTQPPPPAWKLKLLRRISDLESMDISSTDWGGRLVTRVTPAFMAKLHQAASRRNITIGAYIRRSVIKQLSIDLDEEPQQLLALTPYPTPYSGGKLPAEFYKQGRNGRILVPDNGEGYGDWQW